MAQIKATLSLVTSSVSSERFSFNASRLLTTQNPSIQTKTVDVATGSDTAIVTPAAGSAAYVFIFNQDNENFVKVKFDDGGGNALYGTRVGPKETTWICVDSEIVCSLKADTAQCKVEYGYFTFKDYNSIS